MNLTIPTLEKNKHVGILFTARSGSHVLRHFISTITDKKNLGEPFNPIGFISREELKIVNTLLKGETKIESSTADLQGNMTSENIKNIMLPESISNLKIFKKEAELNNYTVCSIHCEGYYDFAPELFRHLAEEDTMQFIRLERADLLTAILSSKIAKDTNKWHNPSIDGTPLTEKQRNTPQNPSPELPLKKVEVSINYLKKRLYTYIQRCNYVDQYFPDVPTIYYEQFQNNVANLRNMFNGIPKKIISIPYLKLGINYKEWIENIDEIEDYYEQFVNENKEYFPQYFGRLPHIKIPASQGRQPKDLSQLKMAVGI